MTEEELKGFFPWEIEILERFKTYGKQPDSLTGEKGWKGLWIKGYLEYWGTSYVYGMYKAWKAFCKLAETYDIKIKPGTYQSFRTYFHLLKKLGLVTEAHLRRPGERGTERVYYELVRERIDDPAWTRPFQELYPSADWTRLSKIEKKELREKYKSLRRAGGGAGV